MWDLPGPGLKPMSSALTGRFLTTVPPGKPDAGFLKWVWKDFFLFYFWESLRKICINYSLYVWLNSPVKPSGPGFLVCWEVFDYVFDLLINKILLSDFLFLHNAVLLGGAFLGIFSFLISCPICWHIIVHSNLLWSLHFPVNYLTSISSLLFLCWIYFSYC